MKISYEFQGGRGNLHVVVTEPQNNQPQAVLLCIHGGPGGDHHGPGGLFDELAEIALTMNVATVQFDMYGAGNSDGSADEISLRSQLDDYTSMREFVRNRYQCPIHICGESMGATIAALDWDETVMTYLLLWPAFDLRDTDLRPYLSDTWRNVIASGEPIRDNDIVIGIEFYYELERQDFTRCFVLPSQPCLLVHGQADKSVPFAQSLTAFTSHRGQTIFYAHPQADHGFLGSVRGFVHYAVRGWLEVYC